MDSTPTKSGRQLDQDSDRESELTTLRSPTDICVSPAAIAYCPRDMQRTLGEARAGLESGIAPQLTKEGSGGTYLISSAEKILVGVYKPSDEEPHAENDPRKDEKKGKTYSRAGIIPGEGCLREVAAYLLDHGGFSGVPPTTLADAQHPLFHVADSARRPSDTIIKKRGSFQQFASSGGSIGEQGWNKYTNEDVQKIAILDIRLMNSDRHDGNILYEEKDGSFVLTPIDHGFCLRNVCDVADFHWCWLPMPQVKAPLSPAMKDYISRLDIDGDIGTLQGLDIEGNVLFYFRASCKLLQTGILAGLNLYDIATLCCRLSNDPSALETLVARASDLVTSVLESEEWSRCDSFKAVCDQLSAINESLVPSTSHPNVDELDMSQLTFLTCGLQAPNEVHGDCQAWALNMVSAVMNSKAGPSGGSEVISLDHFDKGVVEEYMAELIDLLATMEILSCVKVEDS